jgi:hypothetical protein
MTSLVSIGEDIWIVDGSSVNFRGFPYPTRCVIIRLQNDDLWVWSPIALFDKLLCEIRSIGRPAHLVSPNKLHHMFLADWNSAFPDARLWGPQSTIKKRSDLLFQSALSGEPPPDWAGQIDQCWFRGSFMMDEIVFFHIPSRTAILADISENFSLAWLDDNWAPWQRYLARLSKIIEGKGYAPLDWRLSFVTRRAIREAKAKLLSWSPRSVVMAHGEWQPDQGREYLVSAFKWID